MSYFYLSSAYSRAPGGIEAAFVLACEQTALLIRAGVPTFSPIVSSHVIAIHGGIDPLDHAFWMAVDAPMMEAARGMIYLKAPGWRDSLGMRLEAEAFGIAGKPIIGMEPGIVPEELRGMR